MDSLVRADGERSPAEARRSSPAPSAFSASPREALLFEEGEGPAAKHLAAGPPSSPSSPGEGANFYTVGPTLGAGGNAVWRDGKMFPAKNFKSYRIRMGSGAIVLRCPCSFLSPVSTVPGDDRALRHAAGVVGDQRRIYRQSAAGEGKRKKPPRMMIGGSLDITPSLKSGWADTR